MDFTPEPIASSRGELGQILLKAGFGWHRVLQGPSPGLQHPVSPGWG